MHRKTLNGETALNPRFGKFSVIGQDLNNYHEAF
jgi:hypothetical protein